MAKGVAVDAAIFGDRTHIFGAYDDDASGTPTNESIESIDYDMAAESRTFATDASSASNAQTNITHPLPTPNANSPTGIQSGGAPGLQGPNDMDNSGATSIMLNHDARGAHGISEAMVTNTTTTSNGPPYNADVPTNTDTSKPTEDIWRLRMRKTLQPLAHEFATESIRLKRAIKVKLRAKEFLAKECWARQHQEC